MIFKSIVATILFIVVFLATVWQAYMIYYLLCYLLTRKRKAIAGKLPTKQEHEDASRRATEQDTVPTVKLSESSLLETFIDYPMVTIQACAYNELGCIEDLLKNLIKIQWPRDRLQIQLLDDSTLPEAVELAARVIEDLQEKGFNIEHRRRENRIGYKAGNLLHHYPSIRGEYVAIFDSDFLPHSDFLLKTIPHFFDKNGTKLEDVGLVQTTWDHFNQTDNILTHVQGMVQNFHFIIQQNVRYRCFSFFPFNGTAGVWRTDAIKKSGNWNYDTVTEDLDIACRAKLQGYRFIYLENVAVPSELPPTMMAYKRQQRRWTQGHMQVGRKIIRAIWKSPFTFPQKIDITYCVFFKLDWIFGFTGIITYPLLGLVDLPFPIVICFAVPGVLSLVLWVIILIVSLFDKKFMNPEMTGWQRMRRISIIPFFYLLHTGLSLWHFTAVIEGLIQNDIPFATTPKVGTNKNVDEDKIQDFADLDDKMGNACTENQGEEMEMNFEGWGCEGMSKTVKRRKPGLLSKSFPQWAPFVEFLLGLYLLIIPMFYEHIVFGIPVMIVSSGFFWVSIPGIKMSMSKLIASFLIKNSNKKDMLDKRSSQEVTEVPEESSCHTNMKDAFDQSLSTQSAEQLSDHSEGSSV